MNTSSDHSQRASHAPSRLTASSTQSSGERVEYIGRAGLYDTPRSTAARPSASRMPSRSTTFAAWELEDDDDKW